MNYLEHCLPNMPTKVILDKSGNIAFHHVGGADYSNPEITTFMNKILEAKYYSDEVLSKSVMQKNHVIGVTSFTTSIC